GPGYDLDGTQLTQSMFTGHLLQQLPAAADDFGLITADSLAFHLKDHLGRVLQSHVDQMPAYGYLPGHDGGDYVLGTGRRQTERTSSPLKQRKGVIVLVSPSSAVSSDMDRAPGIYAREFIGKDKTQWSGIEYHRCNDLDKEKETTLPLNPARGGGPLKHLWLVYTESSEPVASEMRGSYEMLETVDVHLVPLNDAYNVQETFQALANILDNVGAQGLSLEDVIVDVTGGTTPMSIGAGLACKQKADGTSRPSPCKMQYCQPNHLAFAGGRPDTTRLTVPVLLDDPIHTEKDDS
ncbi:MAG: hypothetical protein IT323_19205, partial [Anaerolineae bacterium]|nr:hypothetical protein [Anaerolineae bacterium]